jgi:septum formation protein
VVVAADTVVDLDGVALGKPVDRADAERMLSALSGRAHVVHTAYVVMDDSVRRVARTLSTKVRFVPLSQETRRRYIATGDPFDKAGGYGIQGRGAALVERIDGDYHTVMGFPLGDFVRELGEIGYVLP